MKVFSTRTYTKLVNRLAEEHLKTPFELLKIVNNRIEEGVY